MGGALVTYLRAKRAGEQALPMTGEAPAPLSVAHVGAAFALGCAFVGVSVVAYASNAPDFERYVGSCGTFQKAADPHQVLVPLEANTSGVPVIEVLDPLCPACRGF